MIWLLAMKKLYFSLFSHFCRTQDDLKKWRTLIQHHISLAPYLSLVVPCRSHSWTYGSFCRGFSLSPGQPRVPLRFLRTFRPRRWKKHAHARNAWRPSWQQDEQRQSWTLRTWNVGEIKKPVKIKSKQKTLDGSPILVAAFYMLFWQGTDYRPVTVCAQGSLLGQGRGDDVVSVNVTPFLILLGNRVNSRQKVVTVHTVHNRRRFAWPVHKKTKRIIRGC